MKTFSILSISLISLSALATTIGFVEAASSENTQGENVETTTKKPSPANQLDKKDFDAIGAFGCDSADKDDYERFLHRLEKKGLPIPDLEIYGRSRCNNGNYILQNTLVPESEFFLKYFVRAVAKEYGKEEVKLIINTRDRRFGYTLLEEAIVLNGCIENDPDSNVTSMITFLKRVGGEVRKDFLKTCKPNTG